MSITCSVNMYFNHVLLTKLVFYFFPGDKKDVSTSFIYFSHANI